MSGAEIVLIVNPFWRQVVPILRFDLLTRKERCDVEKHGNRLQFPWLMLDTGKIILGECKENHYTVVGGKLLCQLVKLHVKNYIVGVLLLTMQNLSMTN